MSEVTANELKAITLAFFDTLIAGALLAHWLHGQPHARADVTAWSLASYAIIGTLPLAAFYGRAFTGCVHDRLLKMMVAALAVTAACTAIANAALLHGTAGSLDLAIALAWAPTAVAVLVYERWTRPAPRIPTCILPAA